MLQPYFQASATEIHCLRATARLDSGNEDSDGLEIGRWRCCLVFSSRNNDPATVGLPLSFGANGWSGLHVATLGGGLASWVGGIWPLVLVLSKVEAVRRDTRMVDAGVWLCTEGVVPWRCEQFLFWMYFYFTFYSVRSPISLFKNLSICRWIQLLVPSGCCPDFRSWFPLLLCLFLLCCWSSLLDLECVALFTFLLRLCCTGCRDGFSLIVVPWALCVILLF